MELIYVNFVGKNFKGLNIYEFLFTSQDITEVEGEDWDSYPAAGNPQSPVDYVETAYLLKTQMSFELIQNHESFDMADCVQGVIALCWENDKDDEDEIYEKRLFFTYGEPLESVNNKFYERDIHLEIIYENAKYK